MTKAKSFTELYHDLSSSVIRSITPESTKITYISHNFALQSKTFPLFIASLTRLKISCSLDESAEHLSLTITSGAPRFSLRCTRNFTTTGRAHAFRLPSVITSFAITRYNYSRPISAKIPGPRARPNVCSCV